jgi:molybdopterin synthase sulfur carrier subunit
MSLDAKTGPPPDWDRGRRVTLLMFARAREAAGTGRLELVAATVGEALAAARSRFGPEFAAVLESSRVWVNGEPADLGERLSDGDELAVLPPVSGG